MILEAQKETSNMLENMNSQLQSSISSNNQNLKNVVSNATSKIESMFSVNTVMMYYGEIKNIPSGWQLCDGSNFSGVAIPGLRGRFPLGESQRKSGLNSTFYNTPIGKVVGHFQRASCQHTRTPQK
eukprot:TRINITY_DN29191_c1_g1_i1.p1 TRINITY_DN29191_c1_g1~~TRINITY_DN29191_c1_g1_i1.p1  ORF type:complete len:137 (-),score=11.39 TRINITY_DN29191_c1_g1_i1:158-535(-)